MAATNGHPTSEHVSYGAALRLFAATMSRLGLAQRYGASFDGQRQLYELFGYKRHVGFADFQALYARHGVATRLVRAYPEATWAQPPYIRETNKPPRGETQEDTPFETAWQAVVTRLKLWAVLQRVDLLANLGQYAVLLLGLANQSQLREPAMPVQGAEDLLYVMPYPEDGATILTWDEDPTHATYGQPLTYELNAGGSQETTSHRPRTGKLVVHASRILHIADRGLEDDIYGMPILQSIYNWLLDLEKVAGSASEMFFRDAKRRIVASLKDGYTLSADDATTFTKEIEEFQLGFADFLRTTGFDVTNLAGAVASPKEHLAALLDLIAIATKIPKRILQGSERGELASSQDAEEWKQTITERQKNYAEGVMLRPLVDRFLALRVLPPPEDSYEILWENLFSLSEEKQAVIAREAATALSTFAGPGMASTVMSPERFLTDYLHLDPDDDPWLEAMPDPLALGPGPEEV